MAEHQSKKAPAGSPAEQSVHPALRVLAEAGQFLSAGIDTEEIQAAVAGVLKRGLSLRSVRLWVRSNDGSMFRAAVAPGDAEPDRDEAQGVQRLLGSARWPDAARGGEWLRVPLRFEGANLGLLEALPSDATPDTAPDVCHVLGSVLSPLLASAELSEDLASEIALRTHEIEAQRRFTAQIIDSLPVGLYVIDRDYRIQAWNRKRETGTQGVGRDEVLGRRVFDVLHRQPTELLRGEFDNVFRTGRLEQIEVESTATGESRYYRITKIPMRVAGDEVTHVITIGEDVTEWKTIHQEIAQTEKLAAVGQLAAGVMHEINNPLATLGACVEALQLRRGELPSASRQTFEEYLTIMESELVRCKKIVDGLLDFSRPKARFKRRVPINQLVEDALFLVKHHDRFKGVQLVRQLAPDLPNVEANAEQLIQAFLGLMLNAIDAMEGSGILTVSTSPGPGRSGEVVVAFSDTGVGIPREYLSKIFEPFFTTKAPGRGTGLGLSICYGIVAEHRGRMVVDSQPGRGTTFRVMLPIAGRAEELG